jgi:hypothetical protein
VRRPGPAIIPGQRNLENRYHDTGDDNQILARVGPTTPTRPPALPLALCRLERLSSLRMLFAAERLSPSARERGPF